MSSIAQVPEQIGRQKNEATCGDCQPVGRALSYIRYELAKLLELLILPGG